MNILRNVPLRDKNTFRIDTTADAFVVLETEEDVKRLFSDSSLSAYRDYFILSGGSNVLFTKPFSGLVIHPTIKGIRKVKENDEHVCLEVATGEVWDDFVAYTVGHGWGGLENLSYIPGHVGASPVQNIGAYGVQVSDIITRVKAWDIKDKRFRWFENQDCDFSYRDSLFKKNKQEFLITSVEFCLQKKPTLNLNYTHLKERVKEIESPTIKDVRESVIAIRQHKLPDPKEIGNGGSFFKNPIIPLTQVKKLQEKHPQLNCHTVSATTGKISAAWLIEQAGWKGHQNGGVGVSPNHALVLTNDGNGTGAEVLELSRQIQFSVQEKFGVSLVPEINIL